MNKQITSKIIGQLKQENNFPDWWKSEAVEIPFFDNRKLTITFMDCEPQHDKTFIKEADHALTHFLKLTTTDRNAISDLAYKNCMDFLERTAPQDSHTKLKEITDITQIWNFIYPKKIHVTKRPYISRSFDKEKDTDVVIACEREWAKEDGLQVVFRTGNILTERNSR